MPVAIFNHGYGGKNTEYSYIAKNLAARCYLVASLQLDKEKESSIPKTGNLIERRKPGWEKGIKNIFFTLAELKKKYKNINLDKITLIGHSYGGDMSMMFADLYPQMVSKVISLDGLRYPIPIKDHIPILLLQSADSKQDEGVISKEGVNVVLISDAKHAEMDDSGSEKVKQEILAEIEKFLGSSGN